VLDNHPVLKDRLKACGVFSGIAIGAVAGFEMVITGGFDFITPGREIRQVAPSSYVTVVQEPWGQRARFVPVTSREPLFAGSASEYAEPLEGGAAPSPQPRHEHAYAPVSEDELVREIEALYSAQAPEPSYRIEIVEEPSYDAETPDKPFSVS